MIAPSREREPPTVEALRNRLTHGSGSLWVQLAITLVWIMDEVSVWQLPGGMPLEVW